MSDSLKDQLLKLGFKPPPKPERTAIATAGRAGGGDVAGVRAAAKARAGARAGVNANANASANANAKASANANANANANAKATGQPPRDGARNPSAAARKARAAQAPRKTEAAEFDLARAYALRAKDEREAKQRAAHEAAEKARLKAERKAQVARCLDGAALNQAEAEQPRNFEYSGKIRRIYVDDAQLAALNQGALGVVQHHGRFLLVSREVALAVGTIEPAVLALLIDPDAADEDDLLAPPTA